MLIIDCVIGSMSAISLLSGAAQPAVDVSTQGETELPALPDAAWPEYTLQAVSSAGVAGNNTWSGLATETISAKDKANLGTRRQWQYLTVGK